MSALPPKGEIEMSALPPKRGD